ncbi:MAG: SDR family oxidoreductase [Phycisphaerales bacterium]|nr:SDR family oxidoreductase [Phycisphaerales bacterium]
MELSLTGKRALVCGSTAGIGKAAAIELAKLGADVVLAARNPEKLTASLPDLPKTNSQQHGTLSLDTGDPASVKAAAQQIEKDGRSIHILVNNTGGPPGGAMADATEEQLFAAFQTLLVSAHALTRAVIPGMKRDGYGRIINITSTSVKQPIPNLGLSNAVRAAVANWAKSLSQELGPFGITVNNVLPGYTDTERLTQLFSGRASKTGKTVEAIKTDVIASIPAGRLGRADEIGAAVAFLASPAAGYINGINLPVDGGRLGSL